MKPKVKKHPIEWGNYRLGRESDEDVAAKVRIDRPEHDNVTASTVAQARRRLHINMSATFQPRGT